MVEGTKAHGSEKVVEGSNAETFSGDVWKNLSRLGKSFLHQSLI